jgi:hypothetical protein
MNRSPKSGILIAGGAVVILAVIYFGASAWHSSREPGASGGAWRNVVTLDPGLYQGPAHEAYRVAREHPELLAQLHCYCGCDRLHGHNNLLDCFRDTHGGHCAICVGEAIDAERMYKVGTPIEQIRDALRGRYNRRES